MPSRIPEKALLRRNVFISLNDDNCFALLEEETACGRFATRRGTRFNPPPGPQPGETLAASGVRTTLTCFNPLPGPETGETNGVCVAIIPNSE